MNIGSSSGHSIANNVLQVAECLVPALPEPSRRDATPLSGRRTWHLVVLLASLATLAASMALEPRQEGVLLCGIKWPMGCPTYQNFGIKCALCGLTRSVCSAIRGDLTAALEHHPLGPAVFAFIILQVPYRTCALAVRSGATNRTVAKGALILTAVLLAAIFINWLAYLGGLIL